MVVPVDEYNALHGRIAELEAQLEYKQRIINTLVVEKNLAECTDK